MDDRIGWTGGFGINDAWLVDAHGPHWKREMFREGRPVVAQMQRIIAEDWNQTTGSMLIGLAYFPALQTHGDTVA